MSEDRDRYLWLLVVMAFLGIGFPTFLRSGTPASASPSAAAQASESQPVQQAARAAEPGGVLSDQFLGPLEAMLACETEPPPPDLAAVDLGSWVERCRPGDSARPRKAIVAIVPDPIDSMHEDMFDRLLEAIDRAAGEAGYARDRYYLPWQGDLTARHRDRRTGPSPVANDHETTPGLLLFRGDCRGQPAGAVEQRPVPCQSGFLAVLLVGETSAWGVHHQVLERALAMADALETDANTRTLRILGPTFSGSVASLRSGLEQFRDAHVLRHRGFDVVTGEATSARNQAVMTAGWCRSPACRPDEPSLDYHATVPDDDETMRRFYRWLVTTMDVRLKSAPAPSCTLTGVGILTATDTVYARNFSRPAGDASGSRDLALDECDGHDRNSELKPEVVVRYPSRIAHLRSIYERTRGRGASPAQLPIEDPRRMLDLSLADSDEPVEAVPAFSDKTQLADELVLTGSLKAMCRSDLRFLGIIGVDIIDRLFLAREARRYCPNLRMFTLESDALYAHPDVSDEMNGSLIVSPYPLFPQNGLWTPAIARGVIAPFGDSAAQGTYNAALRLLAQQGSELFDTMPPHPRDPPIDNALPVWVSAAGNGTLWPVAVLEPSHARSQPGARAAAARGSRDASAVRESSRALVTSGQWKWAFGMIWLVGSWIAAGYWLGRYAPQLRRAGLGVFRVFRVFRPIDSASFEHALFSLVALVPVTCAYVAAAGFVLIEPVLGHAPSHDRSLLWAVWTGSQAGLPAVSTVATGLALVAACADAAIASIAAGAARLRGRAWEESRLRGAGLIVAGIVLVAFLAYKDGLVFERDTWITLRERAVNASSGLSPLVPAGLFAAAVFIAARMQLVRMQHRAALRAADPMAECDPPLAECDHPELAGMRAMCNRTLDTVHRFSAGFWPGALLIAVSLGMWWFSGIPRAMTMLEGWVWNWPLRLAALAGLVLALASYIPFVLGCRRLRDYLRRHANLPCVDAFSRLPERAAQKMSVILVKPRPIAEMQRALHQLRLLSSQVRTVRLELADDLRGELDRALSAEPMIGEALRHELEADARPDRGGEPASVAQQLLNHVAATLARVITSQWERPASRDELAATSDRLGKLAPDPGNDLPTAELYRRAADDETRIWLRLAEDFVATQSTTFFHEVLDTLRRLLTTATATSLLLLAAVSSYPFERRPMLLFMMQGLVVVMVIGSVAILSGMEQSEVLRRIRKIEAAGKATWNRSFIVKIAIYGILPIVSVVATQLPSVGSALFGWLPALLGVMQT